MAATEQGPHDRKRYRARKAILLIILPLVLCGIAFWIWDSQNYPFPTALNRPGSDPFANNDNSLQKLVSTLRDRKEDQFWQSLDLTSTSWKATHLGNGKTSVIRFTGSRVYVDPPVTTIGVPFTHDSEYKLLDDRIIEGVIPVPDDTGGVLPVRKRASFEAHSSDGRVYLQTTAEDDFELERVR